MGVILRYPPCFRDFVKHVRIESAYKPTALLNSPFLCHMVYGHLCQCWRLTAPGWHLPSLKHRAVPPDSVWYFIEEPYRAPSPTPPSKTLAAPTAPVPAAAANAGPPQEAGGAPGPQPAEAAAKKDVTPFMTPIPVKKKKVRCARAV